MSERITDWLSQAGRPTGHDARYLLTAGCDLSRELSTLAPEAITRCFGRFLCAHQQHRAGASCAVRLDVDDITRNNAFLMEVKYGKTTLGTALRLVGSREECRGRVRGRGTGRT